MSVLVPFPSCPLRGSTPKSAIVQGGEENKKQTNDEVKEIEVLINESNESSYTYEALLGNKTYEFKVECIIRKGSNEFITTCENMVFVSKTYEEYMLDYNLILASTAG